MARTATITDEQILEAARAVFMDQGLKATTAQIAEQAGISEGSIFRRFSSKHDLFLAAMGLPEPPFFARLDGLAGKNSVEENLFAIGVQMVDFFTELVPKMMMIASSGVIDESLRDADEVMPVKGLRLISNYFDAEIKAGRLAIGDPEILARMFAGSLHHYAFAETVGINKFMPIPKQSYVRGVVQFILHGAAPKGGEDA